MVTYSQISKAFGSTREAFFRNRDDCLKLASLFVDGLIERVQIPSDCVYYRPLDKEPAKGQTYSVYGAAHMENGVWQVGVCVRIQEASDTWPKEDLVLRVVVGKSEGAFELKVDGVNETLRLDGPSSLSGPKVDALYEGVATKMLGTYENSRAFFEEGPVASQRKMGF